MEARWGPNDVGDLACSVKEQTHLKRLEVTKDREERV